MRLHLSFLFSHYFFLQGRFNRHSGHLGMSAGDLFHLACGTVSGRPNIVNLPSADIAFAQRLYSTADSSGFISCGCRVPNYREVPHNKIYKIILPSKQDIWLCEKHYILLLEERPPIAAESLRDIAISLKHIVAHLDKLSLSKMSYSKDETKDPELQ